MTNYIPFNLNYHVKVKLTPIGVEHWRSYEEKESKEIAQGLRESYQPEYLKAARQVLERNLTPDTDGYHRMQMHDFMLIFGQHINYKNSHVENLNVLLEVELNKPIKKTRNPLTNATK